MTFKNILFILILLVTIGFLWALLGEAVDKGREYQNRYFEAGQKWEHFEKEIERYRNGKCILVDLETQDCVIWNLE